MLSQLLRTRVFVVMAVALALSTTAGLPSAGQDHGKHSTFEGRVDKWHGFASVEFLVDNKSVLVVVPDRPARTERHPWVWHGEFFGHRPQPDIELLKRGFHLVYTKVPNLLGCPEAVDHWDRVYAELTRHHNFAPKVALVGLSRGGLYCYNWAAKNPHQVACIYGDAPVCDLKSWPGGKGTGKGSPRDWELALKCYHFQDESAALAYRFNPVDNLAGLAQQRVPLLHVYGDADDVVPWSENTGLVAQRYRGMGGHIVLISKPGVGHHPHGLEDSTPIVDFIVQHALQVK